MNRLSSGSCNPRDLITSHIFLTTWVLGILFEPTIAARSADSFTSALNPVLRLGFSPVVATADLTIFTMSEMSKKLHSTRFLKVFFRSTWSTSLRTKDNFGEYHSHKQYIEKKFRPTVSISKKIHYHGGSDEWLLYNESKFDFCSAKLSTFFAIEIYDREDDFGDINLWSTFERPIWKVLLFLGSLRDSHVK